jgi:putative ABC transport system ATP-binding protein
VTNSPPKKKRTVRRSQDTSEVFHIEDVKKRWAGEYSFVLTIPELIVRRGEKVALVGFSGCGKSTLLDLLAMVLKPDDGSQFVFRTPSDEPVDVIEAWRQRDLDRFARVRMRHMGYVLQTGGLLPFLSVRENINLCRRALGLSEDEIVTALAERLGIPSHLDKFPAQLSVGERQRVAIARAMAHEPAVVMADEPTASLDPINAEETMRLFTSLADERQVTLILATHDWERVAERGFRRVTFDVERERADNTVRATVSG